MSKSLASTMAQWVRNPARAQLHESVLSTVGKTPLVRLNQFVLDHIDSEKKINLFAKCESFNPMSSVKDRLAFGVIEWAEKNGKLKKGQTVVEASSGNTGIGLAMVCAARGYPFVCVMAESFSIERRKLMRFLGAKVVLTNPAHKGSGMYLGAKQLAEKNGWFYPRQFENEANAMIHEETTGPEILEALDGRPLHYFVSGYGTGGTLKGVAKYLRSASPQTKIVACEPDNAPLLYSEITTQYNDDGSFVSPHPVWRPHLLQGWATDFIPKLVDDCVKSNFVDRVVNVGSDDAIACAKSVCRSDGLFTGISGGGTLAGALTLVKDLDVSDEEMNIVVMLPDTGERYLSTPLFQGIDADMSDEEKAIATQMTSTEPPPISLPEVTDESVQFVQQTTKENDVVIWSLQYCEFCWTAFQLLDILNVKYKTVNVDSFEFAKGNVGNKHRAALSSITGVNTFPQIFVKGEFIGGAVDACLKFKDGSLVKILKDGNISFDDKYQGDPFEFLPKWMSQNPFRAR